MAYSKLRNICSRKATKTQNTESLYIRAMACSLHLHPQLSLTETSNQVNVAKKWVLPPFSFQSRATIFHWERQVRRISRAPQLQVEEDKFHVFLEVSVAERFTQLHLNPGRSTPAMDGRNVVVESLSHSNFLRLHGLQLTRILCPPLSPGVCSMGSYHSDINSGTEQKFHPRRLRQKNRGAKSLQSCSTFCDLMDGSPPGFSVHGFLQARILAWVAVPSSRGSSQPRDWTQVSYVCLLHWQAGSLPLEPHGKPQRARG